MNKQAVLLIRAYSNLLKLNNNKKYNKQRLTIAFCFTTMPAMSIKVMRIDMAKKPAAKDWHNADIVASLHKAGHSLSGLARTHGYSSPSALAQALQHPYPKAERLIAEAIGGAPATIWPSRYHADGSPKSGRGERGTGRYKTRNKAKCTSASNAGKVNSRKAH